MRINRLPGYTTRNKLRREIVRGKAEREIFSLQLTSVPPETKIISRKPIDPIATIFAILRWIAFPGTLRSHDLLRRSRGVTNPTAQHKLTRKTVNWLGVFRAKENREKWEEEKIFATKGRKNGKKIEKIRFRAREGRIVHVGLLRLSDGATFRFSRTLSLMF